MIMLSICNFAERKRVQNMNTETNKEDKNNIFETVRGYKFQLKYRAAVINLYELRKSYKAAL